MIRIGSTPPSSATSATRALIRGSDGPGRGAGEIQSPTEVIARVPS
ncbi:hypothetical protein [Actinoplanes sp. HUAS TT8]